MDRGIKKEIMIFRGSPGQDPGPRADYRFLGEKEVFKISGFNPSPLNFQSTLF